LGRDNNGLCWFGLNDDGLFSVAARTQAEHRNEKNRNTHRKILLGGGRQSDLSSNHREAASRLASVTFKHSAPPMVHSAEAIGASHLQSRKEIARLGGEAGLLALLEAFPGADAALT
jgi:hypothetical protein